MAVALVENTKQSCRPKRGFWLYQRSLNVQETSFQPETEILIHSSLFSGGLEESHTSGASSSHMLYLSIFMWLYNNIDHPFHKWWWYYWGLPLSTLENLTVFIKLLLLNFPIILICEHNSIYHYIILVYNNMLHFVSATHSYFLKNNNNNYVLTI